MSVVITIQMTEMRDKETNRKGGREAGRHTGKGAD
jgi:hypothetical protein